MRTSSDQRIVEKASCGLRAFTLIEVMIAVSIMAIILAVGMPSVMKSLRKEGLRKAVSDLVEGCSHARAHAILQGVPVDLVIRAADGMISIQPARAPGQGGIGAVDGMPERPSPRLRPRPFSARLDDDIAVRMIGVNFREMMDQEEVRVRFFPNGTSDEFTIVIFSGAGERMITLDAVTALADVQVIR